jgi:hypothetical protein
MQQLSPVGPQSSRPLPVEVQLGDATGEHSPLVQFGALSGQFVEVPHCPSGPQTTTAPSEQRFSPLEQTGAPLAAPAADSLPPAAPLAPAAPLEPPACDAPVPLADAA